jgi:hypothetical protein
MLVRSTALKESTDARPGLLIFRNYESVEHARALPKGEGIRLASHSRLLNSDWQREDQRSRLGGSDGLTTCLCNRSKAIFSALSCFKSGGT